MPKAPAPPLVPVPTFFGNRSILKLSKGVLLGGITVTLISADRLGAIEPERIGGADAVGRVQIGIAGQQTGVGYIIIRRWGTRLGEESWLARHIGGVRIRAEIMIERYVLPVNNDQMLNGSGRRPRGGGMSARSSDDAAQANSMLMAPSPVPLRSPRRKMCLSKQNSARSFFTFQLLRCVDVPTDADCNGALFAAL